MRALGDLKLRTDDLDGAADAYEAALLLCRAIQDRLGEANALRSLGDLKLLTDDLDGADAAYEAALPLFRMIQNRLGEAGVLQGQGLLALARGDAAAAFRRFSRLLHMRRHLRDALGQQAALGYLARAAAQSEQLAQAVCLAEASLDVGRRIDDKYGQTLTLDLQLQCFHERDDAVAVSGAALVRSALAADLGDAELSARMRQLADQNLAPVPTAVRAEVLADPEKARRSGVARAADELKQGGRDVLSPLPESTEARDD